MSTETGLIQIQIQIGGAVEGAAAEHAAGIVALAAADDPIPGGKAAWHASE